MSLSSECATSAYASEDVVSHCVVSWVRPGRFRYNACHQTSSMLWHSGGYFAVGYFAMARWLCTSVPWARMVRLHRPSTAAVGKTGATGLKKQEVALLTAAAASRRAEAAFRCCLSTSRAVIRAADYHGILRVISFDTPVSAVRRRRVQRSHGNECGVPIPLSSTHIECEGPAVLAGQFVCPRANLRLAHVSDCRRPHPHVTVFG